MLPRDRLAAAVLGRTVLRGPRVPLILELPPYRVPMLRSVLQLMWTRSRLFLSEAGTLILCCTIGLWALLSFPRLPEPPAGAPPAGTFFFWDLRPASVSDRKSVV